MNAVIFTNTRIFDGTGTAPFAGEVRVEGDRIIDVAMQIPNRDGATVIDCGGGVLMPGLIEPHAHLDFGAALGRVPANTFVLAPKERLIAGVYAARTMLDHGYTSAVSAGTAESRHFSPGGNSPRPNDVYLKEEIESGHLPGPRLRSCSGQWSPAFADPALVAPFGYIERSKRAPMPQAARDHVNGVADAGVEIVKIGLNGESGVVPGSTLDLQLYDEEVAAVVDTARERGLDVSAHIYSDEGVRQALRCGVKILYHCVYMTPETADMIARKGDDVFLGIGLGALWIPLNEGVLPPPVVEKMEARPTFDATVRAIRMMRERGVPVLPGADYGLGFAPIGRNALDLELFVTQVGYTPAEVLHLATAASARLTREAGEIGLVRPGCLADVIVVDGDPTIDIAVLQDVTRITTVMKGGVFHKNGSAMERRAA